MSFFCQTRYTQLRVLQAIVLAHGAVFIPGSCSISWSYLGLAIEFNPDNQTSGKPIRDKNFTEHIQCGA